MLLAPGGAALPVLSLHLAPTYRLPLRFSQTEHSASAAQVWTLSARARARHRAAAAAGGAPGPDTGAAGPAAGDILIAQDVLGAFPRAVAAAAAADAAAKKGVLMTLPEGLTAQPRQMLTPGESLLGGIVKVRSPSFGGCSTD